MAPSSTCSLKRTRSFSFFDRRTTRFFTRRGRSSRFSVGHTHPPHFPLSPKRSDADGQTFGDSVGLPIISSQDLFSCCLLHVECVSSFDSQSDESLISPSIPSCSQPSHPARTWLSRSNPSGARQNSTGGQGQPARVGHCRPARPAPERLQPDVKGQAGGCPVP